MSRWMGSLIVAGLLAAPALAQDAVNIKLKQATTGHTAKVDKKENSLESFKITDKDGNKVQGEDKKKSFHFIYTETIVERGEGSKRPLRLKRVYEKATRDTEEGPVHLRFEGKTVLIEKKDGRYHFTFDNGDAVPEASAKPLEEEFNKKDEDGDFLKVLMPPKAVKVNDSWDLPAAMIGKHFEEKDGKVKFDHDKSNGKGKLLKVYDKNGQKFGVMELRVELFPLAFTGEDGNEFKVDPGAKLVIELKSDTCIDGSATTGMSEVLFTINATADIPGQDLRLVLNLRGQNNVNQQEAKK